MERRAEEPAADEAPLLSVVICTYNRADLLERMLDSLAAQELDLARFEVIVVDNNSRDRTTQVVAAAAARRANVRCVHESAQGLSHARNRGFTESRGDYIGFVDDDCKAPADWLRVAAEIATDRRPELFGGPFFAFYDSPKPSWYRDDYGAYVPDTQARSLRGDEFFYGGHIFFRRDTWSLFGGFDATLGMTGERLAYGEEIVPQQLIRMRRPDAAFWYEPRLFVWHLVRPEKLSVRWSLRDAFIRSGYVERVFRPDAPRRRRPGLWLEGLRATCGLAGDLARAFITRDRRRWPHWQQYVVEHSVRYVRWLGALREHHRRATWFRRAPQPTQPSAR